MDLRAAVKGRGHGLRMSGRADPRAQEGLKRV